MLVLLDSYLTIAYSHKVAASTAAGIAADVSRKIWNFLVRHHVNSYNIVDSTSRTKLTTKRVHPLMQ